MARTERSAPSLRANFLLSSSWQILQLVSPFITAPYISRVLQPDGVGTYSYTRSIQLYFSLFATLGTAVYGTREVARSRNDRAELSQKFWEIELLSVATSGAVICAWLVFALAGGGEYRILFLILTMNLFSVMFDISWLYAGLEEFRYIVAKNALFQLAGIVLQFTLVRSKSDLPVYVAVMAGTAMLGNLSMWIPLRRFVAKPDFSDFHILPHFRESFVYFVPAVATSLYTLLDKVLIGALTKNPDENGFYEQATQVVGMGKALTFVALNQVLGSRISFLFKESRIDEIKARIDTSCRYILCMGCAVAFGIAAVSDTFIPWFFGERFGGAVILLKLLCPLVVIIGISNLLGSHYYTPAGLRKQSAVFIVAGAALNVALTVLLIPRLNALGAVIGTFAAELSITVLYVAFCRGYLTAAQIVRDGWRAVLAGAAMFCAVSFLNRWSVNEFVRLFVQVTGGAVLYGGLLLLLRDEFVCGILRKGLARFGRKSHAADCAGEGANV